ncbi:MalY/PatB family protein [Suttonella ornithocola]|uniref:cysteine-S-conjugate beta-lyase n=1 Tax=Suttonella ornithocola TaxID=279832 RepID=A0A380MR13_9GAMM|nr:PatB family C-S lyase [Suttonella ornithocola]SUO94614.1 Cystathionine beta-lyase PatB [Suttonella ornithocola]
MKISNNRQQSDSKKWQKYVNQDIIPLWIADTDFEIAPEIIEAAEKRLQHPVFGYPYDEECFLQSVVEHCQTHYEWQIQKEWLVPIPGCVPGLNFSRAVSQMQGKNIAVTVTPTYPPFFKNSAMLSQFQHQLVPALYENQQWKIDFDSLEQAASERDCGLLILCHPHNPIGRAYTTEELAKYHEIAKKHDLIVCSDEIHCDLILNGTQHRPFAMLDEDALSRTITLMAPSKTYNIAGQCCAFAIIADSDLRHQFRQAALGLNDVNVLGRVMATAAYQYGEQWRQESIAYLAENARLIAQCVERLEGVSMAKVEATYLAFIDCRGLKVDNPQQYFESYGLGFADGADYDAPGFVRLNFGCSRELLQEALKRFEKAVTAANAL